MTTDEWYLNLLSGQAPGQQNVPPPLEKQPPWMQGPDLGPDDIYSHKWQYVTGLGDRTYSDTPHEPTEADIGWYPWVDPMKEQEWTTGVGHINGAANVISTPAPKDNFYNNLMKWLFSTGNSALDTLNEHLPESPLSEAYRR